MKRNDAQLGKPNRLYRDTKSRIESITGLVGGEEAFATDNPSAPFGIYNSVGGWHWYSTGSSGGSSLNFQDEGVPLGIPGTVNFVGENVTVTVSGTVARVLITGSLGVHNDLSGLQGGQSGQYWHLNPTQIIGLVSGTFTNLHYHSGSAISIVDEGNFYTGTTVESALQESARGRTILESNANAIYQVNASSASLLVMTIATLPGGAVFTYNITSGNEDILNVASSSQIGKVVLHNTTRGTEALLSSCVVGTNTITLTANVPAGWQVGDTVTPESQTNTSTIAGGAGKFIDVELQSSGALNKANIILEFVVSDTGGAGSQYSLHPYESNANAKRITRNTQSTSNIGDQIELAFISNRFCLAWTASGAGTGTPIVRLAGYIT